MTDLAAPYVDALDRLVALTDGLSFEDFNRKPSPKGWSAGECVVHLNKIAKGYLPRLEAAAAQDGPRGEPPFRYGWLSRRFIESMRPGSRRIPTANAMRPPAAEGLLSDVDPERALERYRSDTDRFLAAIRQSEGLDLAAVKVRSPFLPLLRLPLGAMLEALGLHCQRHVGQAERAVASPR